MVSLLHGTTLSKRYFKTITSSHIYTYINFLIFFCQGVKIYEKIFALIYNFTGLCKKKISWEISLQSFVMCHFCGSSNIWRCFCTSISSLGDSFVWTLHLYRTIYTLTKISTFYYCHWVDTFIDTDIIH